jgi:hypothetical protein
VQDARPTSLSAVVGLARLYEARQQAQNLPSLAELQKTHSPPPMLSLVLTNIQTPYVKKLTPEEMKDFREKRLCFNCDEKFVRGHKCAKLFWLEICCDNEEL